MCEINKKSGNKRIDPCMRNKIEILKKLSKETGIVTVGCCCGHGKYKETIIVKHNGKHSELITNTEIPRKKRFYLKDKDGYYYIPELRGTENDKTAN